MKVLVTGSSGQLGSYMCELLMRNNQVLGLDIRDQMYADLRPVSVRGDICEPSHAKQVLRNVDAVVHCAAQVSVEKSTLDPLSDARTNVLGTVNLLHESLQAGVSKFVYVSSAAIFGPPKYIPLDENHPTQPMSNYGASKLAGEKYTLAYSKFSNMETVCVRPFNFYSARADPESPYSGVITKFIVRARQGQPPVIEGDGRQTRDFIHAKDVARMIELILARRGLSGEVFNCGCGASTSVLQLANTVIALSGKPSLKPEFVPPRVGDIRDSLASTAKSSGVLGFRPRISLQEGLKELLT